MDSHDKEAIVNSLNNILELELAGVIRYTHYSFMIYGYNRIPIVSWLRDQAQESHTHALQAGEMITHLDGYPSLAIAPLLENRQHDVGSILRESLKHEEAGLDSYYKLLDLVKDKYVVLEEYARRLICEEEEHIGEVNKMLRQPK